VDRRHQAHARGPRPGAPDPVPAAGPGHAGAPVTVEQFPGGHSNLTYLVKIGEGPGERELVLRRPPFGAQIKTAHDMDREFAFLSKLAPVYPRVPRPLLLGDESVLGARFYVMERVRGVVLRSRLPAGLTIDPTLARGLSVAAVETLAELHAIDIEATGLAALGHPDGYVRRQVEGWTRRYAAAVTDDIPAMERVATWLAAELAANRPESGPPTLIHNDFKYDNLVLDPADLTRVRGVLDWEMATVGDPLMDLGTALCYWVELADPPELRAFAFGPTASPAATPAASSPSTTPASPAAASSTSRSTAPSASTRPPSWPSKFTCATSAGTARTPASP
jgi:aminoglycoside phosphotransferase (APT) family kinase protein